MSCVPESTGIRYTVGKKKDLPVHHAEDGKQKSGLAAVQPLAQVSQSSRRSMTGVMQLSDNPAAHLEKSGKNPLIFAENRIFPRSLL